MLFAEKIEDNILIITPLPEHLDASNASLFKEEVFKALENTNALKIICDLKNVNFIDSSGLGAFLAIQRHLHFQHGEAKLTGINSAVQTMFEMVSMHRLFEIFKTNKEALQSFKQMT